MKERRVHSDTRIQALIILFFQEQLLCCDAVMELRGMLKHGTPRNKSLHSGGVFQNNLFNHYLFISLHSFFRVFLIFSLSNPYTSFFLFYDCPQDTASHIQCSGHFPLLCNPWLLWTPLAKTHICMDHDSCMNRFHSRLRYILLTLIVLGTETMVQGSCSTSFADFVKVLSGYVESALSCRFGSLF